uniref:Glucan endo-1,3-beta-glucosidase 11 n=1 Tax=Ananas comosus var. bracteatus TaxID=296719 RepID=A0A6V7QKD1_ANACO|nr:unnamed protein product [Ananas comosus var. bracteatus]
MASSLLLKSRALPIFLLLCILSSEFGFIRRGFAVGINYGQVANNLPEPEQVLALLTSLKIAKTRIYDTNPRVLTAFANSSIDIVVTVPNDAVALVTDPREAAEWVATNVKPYYPATRITGIAVGNEVYTTGDAALMTNLVPAMLSLHSALADIGLDQYIHVSTANSLAVLANSYPPSLGTFRPELVNLIEPFLKFLEETNAPFWVNAYPYFAYKDDPEKIPLDYVLFNPNAGTMDPNTGLHYDNMLYAQVDALLFAMARMGIAAVDVRVSETGWPSRGTRTRPGHHRQRPCLQPQPAAAPGAWRGHSAAPRAAPRGLPLRALQRGPQARADVRAELRAVPARRHHGVQRRPHGIDGSASVSLTSSAVRELRSEFGGMWCWLLVFSLTFQALVTRRAI